ncbi:MurR/RpiR family transcriptional regulator [Pediococcus ethanolidurans]|uniref:MurR/RpiR family transcriptional regulator n=1 Tax=Pediococcus ethanolidurans TaxID=319653 RepID=UPI001C1EAB64|nr:MurR/RpiR family transcriptional regulator [Pediococcus ethanolidurans]MBU7554771.1 MurR/RpiR family transcriptional regulator [Pediococcus ethanolidurans]MDV7719302.1 SIS domain-containing protein [Pediococcus ethanolidurans]
MKSILFSIHSQIASFSKSEQKVAQFILDHPQKVIGMNADALANKVGVSAATVVRLAKILSSDGFPGVKIQLSAETKVDDSLYTEVDPKDPLDVVKQKMEFRIGHTIEQTNLALSDKSVQSAAQLIAKADDVYAYGLGASSIVAADFQQKFIRVGKPVIQTMDTHLIATGIVKPETVLVLVSNTGETVESQKLAEVAKEHHVPVITITHSKKSSLAKKSDIILLHDDSEENEKLRTAATTSLMAQLYVVDLLYYSYLTLNFDSNATILKESRNVIQKHFK